MIRAGSMLLMFCKEVFRKVAELDNLKTVHSVELTEWLIEHAPEELTEIADALRRFRIPPALSPVFPARLPDLETESNVAHRGGP